MRDPLVLTDVVRTVAKLVEKYSFVCKKWSFIYDLMLSVAILENGLTNFIYND